MEIVFRNQCHDQGRNQSEPGSQQQKLCRSRFAPPSVRDYSASAEMNFYRVSRRLTAEKKLFVLRCENVDDGHGRGSCNDVNTTAK